MDTFANKTKTRSYRRGRDCREQPFYQRAAERVQGKVVGMSTRGKIAEFQRRLRYQLQDCVEERVEFYTLMRLGRFYYGPSLIALAAVADACYEEAVRKESSVPGLRPVVEIHRAFFSGGVRKPWKQE
jgi:hypothetical protein